ncbi:hypothetical protein DOE76_08415 [Leifsonia sp. ku-ls]|nr:hypothetical protein DOE76_08415 [Leifsonia sp. ku-ls]
MRTLLRLSAVLISAAVLTGCTPQNPSPTRTTATSGASAGHSTDAPALPSGVTQATNVPSSVPNDPAQRKNVTVTDCGPSEGGWRATGTAKTSGESAATYKLTVFFTTSTATVLAVGEATVTVQRGSTAEWAVDSSFTAPKGTRCVLTGVAAQ